MLTEILKVRLSKEDMAKLREKAEQEDRDLSNMARQLISEGLKRRGGHSGLKR